MTRKDSKKTEQNRERNAAAMRRLEELLRNPGPGITVRPVGSPRDQMLQPGVDAAARAPHPEPQSSPELHPRSANPASDADSVAKAEPHQPAAEYPDPRLATQRRAEPAVHSQDAGAPSTEARAPSDEANAEAEPPEEAAEPAMSGEGEGTRAAARPSHPALAPETAHPARAQAQNPQPPVRSHNAGPSAEQSTSSAPLENSRAARAVAGHLRHIPEGLRSRLIALAGGAPALPGPASVQAQEPSSSPPGAAGKTGAPPAGWTAGPAAAPAMPGVSELKAALLASRPPFLATGLFSLVINVLMLAGPLFMLQVYDRVLTSGSLPTLVALTVLTAALYALIGVLELTRSRVIVRIGAEIDRRVGDRIFRASLRRSLINPGTSMPAQRELDTLRQFLAGPGPITFFDAPWTPVYLLVIFMVHWTLGMTATMGALLLLALTWIGEKRGRVPLTEAGKAAARSIELAETGQRNAEAITAMGMLGAYRGRWQEANAESIAWQVLAADRLGSLSALSKSLKLLLQSLMLAFGAALALEGMISPGAIIASTIIFGRALAPVEQIIGHWKGYLKARESYDKLDQLLAAEPEPPAKTALPAPSGRLEVESLRVAAPETRQLILSNVAFHVAPGEMLAVIGPSASGKSTLARTLVGLWPPFSGTIRLDGARLDQWDQEALGRHIGYLPQAVDLFAGTVKENIARFLSAVSDEEIIEAAQQAHAHEMILALPKGYETQLGAFGTYLSSGQRQRIGLARALFRNPALVVLDEPNANLDRAGDEALSNAIDGMRARGQAIVLVSHRVQAIGKADLLLYLDRGIQRAFGPRREVMKLFQAGLEVRDPQPAASSVQQSQSGSQEPKAGARVPT